MYFDAVLDKDMKPLFNGTPEETKTWLSCYGDALVDVADYLQICKQSDF